jgi:hypothetical protein
MDFSRREEEEKRREDRREDRREEIEEKERKRAFSYSLSPLSLSLSLLWTPPVIHVISQTGIIPDAIHSQRLYCGLWVTYALMDTDAVVDGVSEILQLRVDVQQLALFRKGMGGLAHGVRRHGAARKTRRRKKNERGAGRDAREGSKDRGGKVRSVRGGCSIDRSIVTGIL